MNFNLSVDTLNLLNFCDLHSIIPEPFLSSLSDIRYFFHGLQSFDIDLTIILHGLISLLFKLEDGVLYKLFIMKFSIGFGPCQFSWIVFGLKMFMALGSTKPEGFAVVSNKHNSVAWIYRSGAEVALLNSHFNNE
jgi:hypothetical protein